MRRPIRLAAACLVLGLPSTATAQHEAPVPSKDPVGATPANSPSVPQPPVLGQPIKDFELPDSTGKKFRSADARQTRDHPGEITVLTFWCSICGSCRVVEHDIAARAERYKAGGGGVRHMVVASNYDETAPGVNRFLADNKLRLRVLMDTDSELARYFGATLTTTTAVIDAQGRLRYYGNLAKSEDAVKNLLAGEEVAVPETTPDGCFMMPKPAEAAPEQAKPPAPPAR